MERSISEIMNEPATVDEIIRKANEINDRLREVDNMPELEEEERMPPICRNCHGNGCWSCNYDGRSW